MYRDSGESEASSTVSASRSSAITGRTCTVPPPRSTTSAVSRSTRATLAVPVKDCLQRQERRSRAPTLQRFVRRLLLPLLLVTALVAGLGVAALAWAGGKDADEIATGIRVAHVDVGGLSRA